MSNLISKKKVKPRGILGSPILLIGEAPGFDEETRGEAFVGEAGDDLNRCLSIASIPETDCYIMNLCNYRPNDNNFDFLRDSAELKEGLSDIQRYITENKSRIKLVLTLGKEPLRYIHGKVGDGQITNWRGSFFKKDGLTLGVAYHPAYITRQRQNFPILAGDFRRAKWILNNGLPNISYNFSLDPKGVECEAAIREIEQADEISIDLETLKKNPKHIRCIGVGLSSTRAIVFYNHSLTGLDPVFHGICDRIMACKAKKIFHNGYAFDTEVLYLNHIADYIDYDTMVAANSLNPEFPLGLDFLVSIYTWQPCYWDTGDHEEKMWSEKTPREKLMNYCAIDCCVLFPIKSGQQKGFMHIDGFNKEPLMLADYEYKMSMIPVAKHITRAGMYRDPERKDMIRKYLNEQITFNQTTYDALAGKEVNPNGKIILREVLYGEFKLPIQKDYKTGEVTTKEDAIVKLIAHCQEKINSLKTPELKMHWRKILAFLKLTLLLRGHLKTKSSYIDNAISSDGRARSTHKITGTETNRWAMDKYVDNTGWNASTLPREVLDDGTTE